MTNVSQEILVSQDDEKDVFVCLDLLSKRLLYVKLNFHDRPDCCTAVISRSGNTFIIMAYNELNSLTSGVKDVSEAEKLFEEVETKIFEELERRTQTDE